jgi:hypothetical protein
MLGTLDCAAASVSLCVVLVMVMITSPTSHSWAAEDVCVEAGDKGYDEINKAYDPKL